MHMSTLKWPRNPLLYTIWLLLECHDEEAVDRILRVIVVLHSMNCGGHERENEVSSRICARFLDLIHKNKSLSKKQEYPSNISLTAGA